MKASKLLIIAAVAVLGFANVGCGAVSDALAVLGVTVEVVGSTDIECDGCEAGDVSVSYELYRLTQNEAALDNAACDARFEASGSASASSGDDDDAEKVAAAQDDDDDASAEGEGSASGEATCFGEVDADALTNPYTEASDPEAPGDAEFLFEEDGSSWTMSNLPIDLFIIYANASVADGTCTGDVIGYDDETRLITSESAIAPDSIEEAFSGTFSLPRNVSIYCQVMAPAEAPPEVVEQPVITDPPASADVPLPAPPVADPDWTAFTADSDDAYGTDAVDGVLESAADCSDALNLNVSGTAAAELTDGVGYAHVMEGQGDAASIRTVPLKASGADVSGIVSLSGNYAAIQLDIDDDPTNGGLSNIIVYCSADPDPAPAQQFLMVVTWDTDDTDIDTHVYGNDGEEIWYAGKHKSWGDLDVDDVNGYGPETVSSTPGTEYAFDFGAAIHYYSDHGNGPTTVTVRALYVCGADTGTPDAVLELYMDDITLSSGEWFTLPSVGPGACVAP